MTDQIVERLRSHAEYVVQPDSSATTDYRVADDLNTAATRITQLTADNDALRAALQQIVEPGGDGPYSSMDIVEHARAALGDQP